MGDGDVCSPMEEPGTWVKCVEANCNVVPRPSSVHDIADDWVLVIVTRVSSAPYNAECMPMQMERVLLKFSFGWRRGVE